MRIALISDVYPPLRSSGAVQLRDLSFEFVRQGHQPTVLIPAPELDRPWQAESSNRVEILRLRAPRTKDIGYLRRTIGETLMPFSMLRNLKRSPLARQRWDGVIWYSPTIFWGPLARYLSSGSACRSYLIIRDIFPEWAVDTGVMRRGLPYLFFKAIEQYQYSVADVIGVQTSSNLSYFGKWAQRPGHRVEVLHNWLTESPNLGCSIRISSTPLAGRKVFVYAGNMGVAQGMDILLDLAERLMPRQDLGFLFVGRGRDALRLRDEASARRLSNVAFFDEIDPAEIPGLFAQCHVGLVALDPRHRTHNIPGKFISYMQYGLPVLASINPGNDLADLIDGERVGRACTDSSADSLEKSAHHLADMLLHDTGLPRRCRTLAARLFSPETAVKQIVAGLTGQATNDRRQITPQPALWQSSKSNELELRQASR